MHLMHGVRKELSERRAVTNSGSLDRVITSALITDEVISSIKAIPELL